MTTHALAIDVQAMLRAAAEATDRALDRLLPPAHAVPGSIHAAMRYSVFAGGKRLRPALAMEAARAVAGKLPAGVEDLGAAIEMLHTYSLIHDDLPALDNDDLRRGKPTCHKVFGEAIAILTGDALQSHAYRTLARLRCPCEPRAAVIGLIAEATGTVEGMIGGQVLDIEGENVQPTAASVAALHRAGGLFAGADERQATRLSGFGRKAGLAVQIVDDVLDMTQSSEQLGKTAGKDQASEKATWPAVHGVEQSRRDADRLIAEAFAELEEFGGRADGLKALAAYLVERTH